MGRTGIVEVLGRIAGKIVMQIVQKDVIKVVGCLHLSTGQEARSEAAVRAMQKTQLIDVENALSTLHREVLLNNTECWSPELATFIYNCYIIPATLFNKGGTEIKSLEGTTQGDPTVMVTYATYAIWLTPSIDDLQRLSCFTNHAAFADDLTSAEMLNQIKSWWEYLQVKGPKYGYYHQNLTSL